VRGAVPGARRALRSGDLAGARVAGLRTAWISTTEKEYLSVYPQPDVVADNLAEAGGAHDRGGR